MEDITAISGLRDYPDRSSLFRGLDNLHSNKYMFGGARGVDTDALEYIGRTQPWSQRIVVVPNRLVDQPRLTIPITRKYSTKIIELKNTGISRYQIRNRYMVDNSAHLRAFYDFRGSGGTYNTIQYAKSIGKSYDIWPMNEYDQDKFMKQTPKQFNAWFDKMRTSKVNLSSIKLLIIAFITKVLDMTVRAFIQAAGYIGTTTLEQLWNR